MLTKLEVKRQLAHIFVGLLLVMLLNFDVIDAKILLIILAVGIISSFASKRYHMPIIYKMLQIFDREKDLEKFPGRGAVFYLLGAFLAVWLFPKNIALASIMILALGDSFSRLVGPYGYLKHPFNNLKFLEGIFAGAIAGFLGALLFVSWYLALAASIVSMIIEGLNIRIKNFRVDDNFLIPLVSGFVMRIVEFFV